jgi:hypothetical protein
MAHGPVRPNSSWLVLMRETCHMVKGDSNDVKLTTEELMMMKVVAQLLKPLIQQRKFKIFLGWWYWRRRSR